ncbi:MAG: BamA/TamA family outer membrane protein [Ferruginibacter sp.]
MKKQLNILVQGACILLAAVLLNACNPTKYVPKGDKLYTGAGIEASKKELDKEIKATLKNSVTPQPNKKILGMRIKLAIFNMFKEPKKKKGLFYKIKYNIGEPPVLLSQADTSGSRMKMEDILFAKGWLRPEVRAELVQKEKTASARYFVRPGTRYTINSIFFLPDTSDIAKVINESKTETLLKPGDFMDLDIISQETDRIELYLKERGYYYFDNNNILFKVDSLHSGKVDLYLTIKKDISKNSLQAWKMGDIYIYSNYNFNRDSSIQKQKGKEYEYFWQIDRRQRFKPSVFESTVLMREDSIYRRTVHSRTIERLMNLNTFRFVRMAFDPESDTGLPRLNARIYLTPSVKQNFRFEVSGNQKSNHFVGSDFSIAYKNLNVFGGAEIFDLKVTGGFDWQVGGADQLSPNAQSFTTTATLTLPRILPHIKWIKNNTTSGTLPRTVFSTAIEFLNRPNLYTLRSVRGSAGYTWQVGKTTDHYLKLININSIAPSNITDSFQNILNDDITLRQSFEKQLIIGSAYRIQYGNTYLTNKKFNFALTGNIELSGNLLSLLLKSDGSAVGGKKILRMPLSQFTKTEAEARGYLRLSKKSTLAGRLTGGIAFGYGNSETVPYSEQFFIGGASSLRAFRVRTLGPGSFHTTASEYRANEAGEIKAESNVELRYDLTSLFKLAAFVDAGNIWLRKDAADKPGSGINNGFFKTMAVGTGIGLRVDVSVMLLRFDLAFPLRKPWYPDGQRWVLNEIDFGNSTWRKENLILNIGIGYPF